MRTIQPADEGAPPTTRLAGKGALPTIRLATILGMLATAALLGVVSATAGLGVAGWIVGLATGSAATALLVTARMRSDQPAIHPADWVTLTRALLIAGVAGLVADSFGRPVSVTALVTLSTVALVLDAVDGQVARRTGTATPLGARIDGEVDAFLILLLSIAVSQDYGGWVLVIGAARYALLLAGWLIPWLAAPLPPRYWGKVVAAVQGIVLTVAASGLLDRRAGMIAVAAALLLLAESFGRNVIWLYRTGAGPRTRRALRLAITVLSVVLVWGVLVAPDRLFQLTPAAFARIPVEGLVLVAVAVVLPAWPRRIVAAVAGILFGLLTLVKILNIAFYAEIGRAFNPVFGWVDIAPAIGVVRDTIGPTRTNIALAALWLGLILLVGAITAATIHITTVAARHRRDAVRGLAALTAVWALCAGLSLQLVPGSPVASTSAAGLAVAQVRDTQAALRDQRRFEQVLHGSDPEASVPASDLLTGLRGKDVIIAFVESYGQVAVQGTSFSPGVDAVLRRSTASLARAGWSTRSAWLTSPGFGGISQLAHSTLQSGLWVNTEQRYAELVASRRFTLSDAFDKAGWRTVSDSPEDDDVWPPGTSFYHFDKLYDRCNVGYHGPTFSYASMPDQYTLAEFQRHRTHPRPQARDGRDRPGLLAHALGPVADHGALEQGRQRLDIRPHARAERIPAHGLAQRQHRAPVLRPVDPVLAAGPHLMGHRAQRPEPRAHPARRRAARWPYQPPRGQPRGADLDRRPRPFRVPADCFLALAGRAAARSLRSARAHGRLPQPVPRRLQHGLVPSGVGPWTRSTRTTAVSGASGR